MAGLPFRGLVPRYGAIPTKLLLASNGAPTALHRVHRWQSDEGFDSSATIKSNGGKWTFDDLDQFPANRWAYAQGAKMTYAHLSDPAKQPHIVDVFITLSDNPEPLPAIL